MSHYERKLFSTLTVILFFIFFTVRIFNLNYNSPFGDEAIYIVIGKLGLFHGDWDSLDSLTWMGGIPYLYPSLSALFYKIYGLVASRFISILFFMGVLYTVYKIAYLMYPGKSIKQKTSASLLSIIILGVSSVSFYVSRMATYDMASFFFLSLGSYFLIRSSHSRTYPGKQYFLSAVFIALAFFFKYIIAVFIPLLVLFSFLSIKNKTWYRKKVWIMYFMIPISIFIGGFLLISLPSLITFYQTQVEADVKSSLKDVINTFISESNLALIFFALGSIGLIIRKNFSQLLILCSIPVAILAVHLINSRTHTLDKHTFLAVETFALVGGIGITAYYENISDKYKQAFKILLIVILIAYSNLSFKKYEKYNHLWENEHQVLSFAKDRVGNHDIVLSETGATTQLYFFEKIAPMEINSFDWVVYGDFEGEEALAHGTKDGYFDTIILENSSDAKMARNTAYHNIVIDNTDGLYSSIFKNSHYEILERNY